MVDRHRNFESSQAKGIIALKEPETFHAAEFQQLGMLSTAVDCHLVAGKRACRRFNLPRIFILSRMLRGVMWNYGS